MAKPLTKSPPVQFRIPLELWEFLEARAAKRGETPSEYVCRTIVEALEKDVPK
jgi:predicted DNA-binding protein